MTSLANTCIEGCLQSKQWYVNDAVSDASQNCHIIHCIVIQNKLLDTNVILVYRLHLMPLFQLKVVRLVCLSSCFSLAPEQNILGIIAPRFY